MIYKQNLMMLIAVLFGAANFLNAQNHKTMTKTTIKTEELKVLKAVESMTEAFHNKDIEGVMASYEPTVTVVFEPEQPISDRAVLREMFLNAFMINPKFTYSGHEVFISGDIATHIAPWTMTGAVPDGTEIKQSGLSVAILRKQKSGDWLMVIDNPHGSFLMSK